jgi:hypothetical protein
MSWCSLKHRKNFTFVKEKLFLAVDSVINFSAQHYIYVNIKVSEVWKIANNIWKILFLSLVSQHVRNSHLL